MRREAHHGYAPLPAPAIVYDRALRPLPDTAAQPVGHERFGPQTHAEDARGRATLAYDARRGGVDTRSRKRPRNEDVQGPLVPALEMPRVSFENDLVVDTYPAWATQADIAKQARAVDVIRKAYDNRPPRIMTTAPRGRRPNDSSGAQMEWDPERCFWIGQKGEIRLNRTKSDRIQNLNAQLTYRPYPPRPPQHYGGAKPRGLLPPPHLHTYAPVLHFDGRPFHPPPPPSSVLHSRRLFHEADPRVVDIESLVERDPIARSIMLAGQKEGRAQAMAQMHTAITSLPNHHTPPPPSPPHYRYQIAPSHVPTRWHPSYLAPPHPMPTCRLVGQDQVRRSPNTKPAVRDLGTFEI